MRLLLFLSLFPLLVFGQETIADSTNSSRWRLGLAVQLDNGYKDPYIRTSNLLIPKVDRPDAIQLTADYLPFRSVPYLWLNAEFSYYKVTAGNSDQVFLGLEQPEVYFYEKMEMNYWHAGLGMIVEPFRQTRFSPYLGGQFLVIMPTKIDYRLVRIDGETSETLDDIRINSGEQTNFGWEVNVGVRAQLTKRISAALGFYHVYTNYQADWPELEQRTFSDGIMRLDRGGVELRCQYGI